jgi:hypothetical protein
MYKIDAIQKERHSLGIPKGKMLQGSKPADKAVLRQLLRNLRTNEEAFIIEPQNIEVSLMTPENAGSLPDALASASHHNGMILMNVLTQFISLGVEGNSGGRATAGTQSDLFMKSLKYVANQIAQCVNMYLIPELVVWNYPTTNFPKLQVRNIGETRDLQMIAAALGNMFSQDAITPDPATENFLRKLFDMPSKPADAIEAFHTDKANSVSTNGNGNGNGDGSKGSISDRIKTGNVGKPNSAPE